MKKEREDIENTSLNDVIIAMQNLLSNQFIANNLFFVEEVQHIVHRLQDETFRLVVVGEFSSGKSTFINALLGKDILKHGAQETTATITEIKNISETEDDTFDVYYENGTQQKNIPIVQLLEYTSTTSKEHSVAKEIEKVVIKSHMIDAKTPIYFIDTPGLNGVADYHREKTIEQIKNAHACIYLMQVRGLGESDITFLKMISKYQRNIIFVQNFIDELKHLEGETAEQKVEEQRKILQEKVFGDMEHPWYPIVGISARKALLAKDSDIKESDMHTY